MRKVGKPPGQLVVQAQLFFVDQFEQQRRDIGDCDRAVAKVHGGGGRHAGHRVADGPRHDLLAGHGDPDQHRLQMRLRHEVTHNPDDRVALAPLLVGDEAGPVRGGAQPASSPRARTEHPRRRKTGMRRSYRKAAKPVKA